MTIDTPSRASRMVSAVAVCGLLACSRSTERQRTGADAAIDMETPPIQTMAMACTTDDECQNDTYCTCLETAVDGGACLAGTCTPWGGEGGRGLFDPNCIDNGFAPTEFIAPVTHCNFTDGGDLPVLDVPLVYDLDGDRRPEIVFYRTDYTLQKTTLYAVDGERCTLKWKREPPAGAKLLAGGNLAIADLDGNGKPEIIGTTLDAPQQLPNGTLIQPRYALLFDHEGNFVARADKPYLVQTRESFDYSAPAIANLDGVGNAEVIVAGQALRYEPGKLTQIWIRDPVGKTSLGGNWGTVPVIADVDLDGNPEVILGNAILDGATGTDKTPPSVAALRPGYVAVGDFDKSTPEPEIVLISSEYSKPGLIQIFNPVTGAVVFGPYQFTPQWGGVPTVADFDGDGAPEVGVAGKLTYSVWKLECAQDPKPAYCTGAIPGQLWEKSTLDYYSGATGSSVFDFNGDGRAEVVYRDDRWLRVIDGTTGTTLFAATVTSSTNFDYPTIADIDGDGHSEIIVPANVTMGINRGPDPNPEEDTMTLPGPATEGILILRDPLNRWQRSRPMWNQHSYHITNISDDGTVPTKETDNWSVYNNYRQNVQGTPGRSFPTADFTGGAIGSGAQVDCAKTWTLRARLCNRGATQATPGVPGTFYSTDPRLPNAQAVCTGATSSALLPGDCESIACDWNSPPQGQIDLWFRANDPGDGTDRQNECHIGNDLLILPRDYCGRVG